VVTVNFKSSARRNAITPLTEIADRIGQSVSFVKGAAWSRGWTIHEVGTAFCLNDKNRNEILSMFGHRPIPMKRQAKTRRAELAAAAS